MGFWSSLFGGPSSQEQSLAAQQQSLAGSLQSAFSQQFAGQTKVLDNLGQQLTPIASLGPNQQGYSAPELSAMNAAAINNAAAANINARQAVGATLAGRGGGGSSGLVSGIEGQIEGSVASNAANALASAQNQIVQNNYATGRSNFWNATAGENALAKVYSPEAFGSEATNANQSAFSEASKVQSEKGSVLGDIGKVIGAVAGPVLGFATGGLSNLSKDSSFGENVGNFFSGGFGNIGGGQGLGTPGPSGPNSAGEDQLQY